jgi:hypothetical protein
MRTKCKQRPNIESRSLCLWERRSCGSPHHALERNPGPQALLCILQYVHRHRALALTPTWSPRACGRQDTGPNSRFCEILTLDRCLTLHGLGAPQRLLVRRMPLNNRAAEWRDNCYTYFPQSVLLPEHDSLIGVYALGWVRIALTRQWIEECILDGVLRQSPPSLDPVHLQPTPVASEFPVAVTPPKMYPALLHTGGANRGCANRGCCPLHHHRVAPRVHNISPTWRRQRLRRKPRCGC